MLQGHGFDGPCPERAHGLVPTLPGNPPRGAHLGFRLSAALASPGEEPGQVITQHSGIIWTCKFEGDVAGFH